VSEQKDVLDGGFYLKLPPPNEAYQETYTVFRLSEISNRHLTGNPFPSFVRVDGSCHPSCRGIYHGRYDAFV